MSKVITVTLNPAIDEILEIPDFKVGDVVSVKSSRTYPAGKGVNVARTMSCLGKDVLTIGIIGKKEEDFFNTITDGCLSADWILDEQSTRVNMTIDDPLNNTETHIRAAVPKSGSFPFQEVKEKIERYCEEGDIVVFSGSLPGNAPDNTLYLLGCLCKEKHLLSIIDANGKAMLNALNASPFLIKPNLKELQEITDQVFLTDWEIATSARDLAGRYDISIVIISLGKDGAIAYDNRRAKAYKAGLTLREQEPSQLHAVGSGDAMIGGICSGLPKEDDMESILKNGIAAGAANLFSEVPGSLSKDLFHQLRKQVSFCEIKLDALRKDKV